MLFAISIKTQDEIADVKCCLSGCQDVATYEMVIGYSPDDMTWACVQHVASLLGDSPLLAISRVENPRIDYLNVVMDSSADIEIRGTYGLHHGVIENVNESQGTREVIQLIEEGPKRRLRIPLMGGLYG